MPRWPTPSARQRVDRDRQSAQARQELPRGLPFAPQRANSPVRTLSGGERNRLLLARLFARPANVLVLDEPTNDLDIETLELLEELLAEYDGTVFLVSHDRRFLDNVVTSTLVYEGDASWREYEGGVQDWLRPVAPCCTAGDGNCQVRPNCPGTRGCGRCHAGRPKRKLSCKEQRELEIPLASKPWRPNRLSWPPSSGGSELYSQRRPRIQAVTERAPQVEGGAVCRAGALEQLEAVTKGSSSNHLDLVKLSGHEGGLALSCSTVSPWR